MTVYVQAYVNRKKQVPGTFIPSPVGYNLCLALRQIFGIQPALKPAS